ncbi:ANTAR domain-containing protein [Pseudonocardia pini]|uniref:ANTAR domain-containing protein n=1 Tax=Pseudonocardia pini TaxID=2758030 RepID=UPI0015F0873D|nr:ANTAR domain-containing protein [Pseudonocardia pini]
MTDDGVIISGIIDQGLLEAAEVHQAAGMVMAQLGMTAAGAIALLRVEALVTDQPLSHVADEVVARRLRLGPRSDPPPP